ncbi:MAG: hypothetical protein ACRDRU_20995 [Pseudonocardiaceae bacterium]
MSGIIARAAGVDRSFLYRHRDGERNIPWERETDQNRGRSTFRVPGDPSAPPVADLCVGGGVPLIGL